MTTEASPQPVRLGVSIVVSFFTAIRHGIGSMDAIDDQHQQIDFETTAAPWLDPLSSKLVN